MYNGKKIVVVLPAYNAALTLEKTYGKFRLILWMMSFSSMISVMTIHMIGEKAWNKAYYSS